MSQILHNISSKANGLYTVPPVDSSLSYPSGVVSRYDISSLGDNSKVQAIVEVTNESSQPLTLALQESSADISDNGWEDYNFESSFSDLGSSVTIVPKGCHQFKVDLTKPYLQLINKTPNGVSGQVFILATFPKDATEIGPLV